MFRFGNPEYLYLLLLIPILAFMHLFLSYRKKKALNKFGNPELLKNLMPDLSILRPITKFYLLLLALIVLIFALAAPQFGTRLQTVQRQGIEIMIALDVSNSMNSQDIQPNRLERAKQAVSRLTDRLVNDRIGLVVFAGNAYVQLPITSDYASARMFLNNVTTNIVPVQGTAIGRAIELSMQSFTSEEGINRAIIIITDGENHEDDAIGAATKAAEKNIKVYTIGMGSPEGGPIPVGGSGNFLRDKDGNVVITKLDRQMLEDIASAGKGAYFPANNIRAGINQLINELSGIERVELETKVYTDFEDQYQSLILIVIVILLIDFFILERKNRLLKNIDLFTVNKPDRKEL